VRVKFIVLENIGSFIKNLFQQDDTMKRKPRNFKKKGKERWRTTKKKIRERKKKARRQKK
jgi:hypothetical protein